MGHKIIAVSAVREYGHNVKGQKDATLARHTTLFIHALLTLSRTRCLLGYPRPVLYCVPNWPSDSRLPPDDLRRHLHYSFGCFGPCMELCSVRWIPQVLSNLFYDIGPLVLAKTWDAPSYTRNWSRNGIPKVSSQSSSILSLSRSVRFGAR